MIFKTHNLSWRKAMKKILFFSLVFISLIQFGTTAWSLGLKLPELPGVEAKINFSEDGISLTPDFSLPKPFPNLAEAGENQPSFCSLSYDLYPRAIIMENGAWGKIKGTWNGPAVNILTKITTKDNKGFFLCMAAHSWTSSIADAKVHSRGNMKYFSGDGDWHMWKNWQDIFAAWATLHIARQIFVERIPVKVVFSTLGEGGLLRFILFNANMKIVKGGFPAYNDPFYNQHALPYWWFKDGKFTDKYIATGRITTPLFDGLAAGVLIARWSGCLKTSFLDDISVTELTTRKMLVIKKTW